MTGSTNMMGSLLTNTIFQNICSRSSTVSGGARFPDTWVLFTNPFTPDSLPCVMSFPKPPEGQVGLWQHLYYVHPRICPTKWELSGSESPPAVLWLPPSRPVLPNMAIFLMGWGLELQSNLMPRDLDAAYTWAHMALSPQPLQGHPFGKITLHSHPLKEEGNESPG